MKIIFFDINPSFMDVYKRVLSDVIPNSEYIVGDIRNIIKNVQFDALLSPANSYGDMRGGIDAVYIEIYR